MLILARKCLISWVYYIWGWQLDGSNQVEAVRDWPIPKSATEVKSFLGLAGYYHQFVQNFSRIIEPLAKLTRKEVKY